MFMLLPSLCQLSIITETLLPLTRFVLQSFDISVLEIKKTQSLVCFFFFFNFFVSFPLQETFAEYTARTAFERPLLSGVAYAQRVVNSERDQFEKQHGVVIKTMVEREASPIRDEYAPVIFAQETLSYLESIDMMSGEVNNNTFEPL
jgi:histidine kinase 2/3/4 (cytokinin receptor)